MKAPTVLLIEDDLMMRELITVGLRHEGFSVLDTSKAGLFLRAVRTHRADAILIDLYLPDGNGLDLLKKVRKLTDIPVIVVSGSADQANKISCLDAGADDYVTKPVEVHELSARINANIRRHRAQQPRAKQEADLRFSSSRLDIGQRCVRCADGRTLSLTARENLLLEAFCLSPKKILDRASLVEIMEHAGARVSGRAVDVHIARLRKKLKTAHDEEIIRSVHGVGYMMVCDAEPGA